MNNDGVCGSPSSYRGWYTRLLFGSSQVEMDPTIADVNADVNGPRAYAGLAFAYHEVVTGLERLTDPAWAQMAASAPDVPWMREILPQSV